MGSLGTPELLVILLIVVLVFGTGRPPEVGSALGKGIREFRDAASGEPEDSGASNDRA